MRAGMNECQCQKCRWDSAQQTLDAWEAAVKNYWRTLAQRLLQGHRCADCGGKHCEMLVCPAHWGTWR